MTATFVRFFRKVFDILLYHNLSNNVFSGNKTNRLQFVYVCTYKCKYGCMDFWCDFYFIYVIFHVNDMHDLSKSGKGVTEAVTLGVSEL